MKGFLREPQRALRTPGQGRPGDSTALRPGEGPSPSASSPGLGLGSQEGSQEGSRGRRPGRVSRAPESRAPRIVLGERSRWWAR